MTRLGTSLLLLGTVFALGQDRPPTIVPARGAYVEPQPILLRYDFTATELEDPEPVIATIKPVATRGTTNYVSIHRIATLDDLGVATNFNFAAMTNLVLTCTNTWKSAFDERDDRIEKLEARLAAIETQLKEKP